MKAYKNLVKQLFPKIIKETNTDTKIVYITDKARRTEENIVQMCAEVAAHNLFSNELYTVKSWFGKRLYRKDSNLPTIA